MSDRTNDPKHHGKADDERDTIARLLRLAGPRPRAPLEVRERVRRAVRSEWQSRIARRRRRHLLAHGVGLAAVAAALALALGLAPRLDWLEQAEPWFEVASVTATSGAGVISHDERGTTRHLGPGDTLSNRTWIETGADARAAFELLDGGSLRLDRSTRLRFLATDTVALEQGAIYFDSGRLEAGARRLTVETDWGRVRDIGTQFEVRTENGLRVRVREGRVNLDRQGRIYPAGAGVELRLSAGGALSRRNVPLFGPEWDWVLEVARPFGLDGQPLDSFLSWVSRETGREVRFADAALAETATVVRLHGSIAGLRPDEALEAVLPTCGLTHRLDAGTLLIEAETR